MDKLLRERISKVTSLPEDKVEERLEYDIKEISTTIEAILLSSMDMTDNEVKELCLGLASINNMLRTIYDS